MQKFVLAAAFLSAFAQPAAAKDWPDLQNWSFIQGKDHCEMDTTYGEGDDTRLGVMLSVSDDVFIGASGTEWKVEQGKPYKVRYSVEKDAVGETEVKGWVDGEYKGFISKADLPFLDTMMKTGFFSYKIEGLDVADNLDVSGSDQAYAQLKACVAELKTASAQ